MKLEVPTLNDDGSISGVYTLDAQQAQSLLGFALNFLMATGLSAHYGVISPEADEEFND